MTDNTPDPAYLAIPMTACQSSNISQHGYDAASQTLALQFSNGTVYRYPDVPQEVADRLATTKSVGSFFANEIRAVYVGVKQEPVKP